MYAHIGVNRNRIVNLNACIKLWCRMEIAEDTLHIGKLWYEQNIVVAEAVVIQLTMMMMVVSMSVDKICLCVRECVVSMKILALLGFCTRNSG